MASEKSSLLPDLSRNDSDESDASLRVSIRSMRNSFRAIKGIISKHVGEIGMLGSCSIAVNSLTGPAMLSLPATFQKSGILPTTFVVLFVCFLSSLCSLHMANTISKVPRNQDFKREIEFSEAFHEFWGYRGFALTQIIFFSCVTCLNISSIVDTAQVIDTVISHLVAGGTAAFQFSISKGNFMVDFLRWDYSICTPRMLRDGECVPFMEVDGLLLTMGYIITVAIFLPLALMDLKENATWQISGFIVLLLGTLQFIISFLANGIDLDNITLFGESWDTLFGVIVFNFALVIAIPAWLYEKEPHVHVPTVINFSSVLSAFLYISIGALGAMTMPNVSDNMLQSMMSGALGVSLQIGASIFALFIIGLGIPLFSVLARMNLTGSDLCSESTGNILAVYIPFSCSWLLYQGAAVTTLLSWGGIIFTSLVAFILPLVLSIHTLDVTDAEGVISVYGNWKPSSKATQKLVLYILLALSGLAILLAVLGTALG